MTRGEYMRMARNSAMLSTAQLSVMSGVPVCTIRSLECNVSRSGRIDTLELLADALGISIDEYVGHMVYSRAVLDRELKQYTGKLFAPAEERYRQKEGDMMDSPKKFLQQIRLYDSHISTKLEDLQHLKEMVTKITPTLKDNVVSGGGNQDKLGDAIAKIVDLEAEIDRDIDRYVEAKQEISATLDKLTDPDQLQVLHMRYVQNKTWEQIACDMGFSYRWVCTIHGRALQQIEKILKNTQ